MTVHPHDELGGYALGTLDPSERRDVEAHLRTCAPCRTEVEGHAATLWALAEATAADPPAGLRERIVARESKGRGFGSTLRDRLARPVPAYMPLALAVVLVVALAGLVGARRDADMYGRALAGVASGRIVALSAGANTPGARGALVVPATGQPYLLRDLPAAPSGKTWEAWILRGDSAIAAGLAERGGPVTTIVLTRSPATGDGVAVTLEDARGADRPSGAPVLIGRL